MIESTCRVELPTAAIDSAARTPHLPPGMALLLLSLFGLFAYFNSFKAGYVLDDSVYISHAELPNPFYGQLIAGRPLVALTLSMNYYLEGGKESASSLNPRGYHLVNLVIHVAAAFVLYDLVRRTLLMPWARRWYRHRADVLGFAVALLWMLHPLQTQSVTYTIQRCESLMGLFFLLSVYALQRSAAGPNRRAQVGWAAASLVAGILGGMCKEVIIALPFVALLYDATFLCHSWAKLLRRRWLFHLLMFAIVAGCTFGQVALRGFLSADKNGVMGFGVAYYKPVTYALTETQVLLHYLALSVWPDRLCLDYLGWVAVERVDQSPASITIVGAMLMVTVVGGLFRRAWTFPLAWFFLILAPTSSIIPIQDAAFEHRMYLPLACVVLYAVFFVDSLLEARRRLNPATATWAGRAAFGVALVVALIFAVGTLLRNEDYSTTIRMYQDIIVKKPTNFRGYQMLGSELINVGRSDEAARVSEDGLKQNEQYALIYVTAGISQNQAGNPRRAIELLEKVRGFAPDTEEIGSNLGVAYLLVGDRNEDAYTELKKMYEPLETAYLLDTSRNAVPESRKHLWYICSLMETDRKAEAEAELAKWVKWNPWAPRVYANGARYYAQDRDVNASNCRTALLYARAICLATEDKDPVHLETLAIAQATDAALASDRRAALVGGGGNLWTRFAEAGDTAAKAAKLADEQNKPNLAARIRLREALFRRGLRDLPENRGDPVTRARP